MKTNNVSNFIKDAVKDFNSCIDGKPCEECKAHVQLCDCGAETICELLIEHNKALIDKIEQAFNS